MKGKIKLLIILTFLSLALFACTSKNDEKSENIFIPEMEEEKNDGEKNLIRSKTIEGVLKKTIEEIIEKKEYTNYKLLSQEVWVEKDKEKKIYYATIHMELNLEDKPGSEKIFKESSALIEKAIASKYDYEKLELIWDNPNYEKDDPKIKIYYN